MKMMRHAFVFAMLLAGLACVSHVIPDSTPDDGCSALDGCVSCSVCAGSVVHTDTTVERPQTVSFTPPTSSSPCLQLFVENPFQPPRV